MRMFRKLYTVMDWLAQYHCNYVDLGKFVLLKEVRLVRRFKRKSSEALLWLALSNGVILGVVCDNLTINDVFLGNIYWLLVL